MKRFVNRGFVVIFLAVFVSFMSAQSTVREIDVYVASVKKVTNSVRTRIIVADTATEEDKEAKWKLFPSEKALEKFRDKSETYSIAYNWKKGGKLVASNFTDFSASGDWTQYTYHYFRADGTIAKVEAELRTFEGDWIIKRDYYFDTKGDRIKRTAKYLDLTTKKPKKPTPDMLSDDWSGLSVKFYKTSRRLPFARLID